MLPRWKFWKEMLDTNAVARWKFWKEMQDRNVVGNAR